MKRFIGNGLNAENMSEAINNGLFHPSLQTIPAGATWPFARCIIKDSEVSIHFFHIHKTISKENLIIALDRTGYISFIDTNDRSNSFAFLIIHPKRILDRLREYGYHLDDSCESNYHVTQIVLYLNALMIIVILVIMLIFGVLKP